MNNYLKVFLVLVMLAGAYGLGEVFFRAKPSWQDKEVKAQFALELKATFPPWADNVKELFSACMSEELTNLVADKGCKLDGTDNLLDQMSQCIENNSLSEELSLAIKVCELDTKNKLPAGDPSKG